MFKVCEGKCDQCLFTPNRVVSVSRMKSILADCQRDDTHFVCHKAPPGEDVCCRGFYDTRTSQMMRIAQRMDCVEFVAVPGTDGFDESQEVAVQGGAA